MLLEVFLLNYSHVLQKRETNSVILQDGILLAFCNACLDFKIMGYDYLMTGGGFGGFQN